jgi:predicted nucleic acid-binding protein
MNTIVIDSNLAVAQAIPLPYSDQAAALLADWKQQRARLVAPMLWEYEVVSTLRKAVALKRMDAANADSCLHIILILHIELFPPNLALDKLAIKWAKRLDAVVAYDAQYLALAEDMGADLWSADRKLVEAVRGFGAKWIHWVGEALAGEP